MALDAITADRVRLALRSLRYANRLRDPALLELDIVTLRLGTEGLADSRRGRAWVLNRVLEEVVAAQVAALRGRSRAAATPAGGATTSTSRGSVEAGATSHGGTGGVARSGSRPEDELAHLTGDAASGSQERFAWGLLQWRYFSAHGLTAGAVSRAVGVSERTMRNRVAQAIEALVDVLRDRELAAAHELSSQPASVERRILVVEPESEAERQAESPADPSVTGDAQPVTLGLFKALENVVVDETARIRIASGDLASIARHPADDLRMYRLGRIAEWSLEIDTMRRPVPGERSILGICKT